MKNSGHELEFECRKFMVVIALLLFIFFGDLHKGFVQFVTNFSFVKFVTGYLNF
jgi:hypothetical protein